MIDREQKTHNISNFLSSARTTLAVFLALNLGAINTGCTPQYQEGDPVIVSGPCLAFPCGSFENSKTVEANEFFTSWVGGQITRNTVYNDFLHCGRFFVKIREGFSCWVSPRNIQPR